MGADILFLVLLPEVVFLDSAKLEDFPTLGGISEDRLKEKTVFLLGGTPFGADSEIEIRKCNKFIILLFGE